MREEERDKMVEIQLRKRGIESSPVLEAMRRLPRHLFVPKEVRPFAYEDRPLPIGRGQTISQPYMAAYMTEQLALTGGEKVFELGTGSAYQTALLGLLAREVFTMEVEAELARRARRLLDRLGFSNVRSRVGDGLEGWPAEAPFDRIVLTASVEEPPKALLKGLAPGGWLIGPIGTPRMQRLMKLERRGRRIAVSELMPVVFVPVHQAASRWLFGKN
jgi:protein-L-isoaspartate(D-aspartate) O-methyltransferase